MPKGEPRPFTTAQIDAMLASGAYKRTRAMILLGYYQGLRVSSIARVHGKHFDHRGKTLSVVGKGNKLRHAFGSDLVEEGPDIRVVQELMMHDDISSTQIYTRVSERRKREGIELLSSRTMPAKSGRRAAA